MGGMAMISKESKEFAPRILREMASKMTGRFCSPEPKEDVAAFHHFCGSQGGAYLEIGVMWGGSMIIAGLAKPHAGLFGIDPFTGWNDKIGALDPFIDTDGVSTSADLVMKNLEAFGLAGRARLFERRHPPLPPALEFCEFGVVFIDGDHSYESMLADFHSIKSHAIGIIIFHDLHLKGPPRAFAEAAEDPNWNIIFHGVNEGYSRMGVLERV